MKNSTPVSTVVQKKNISQQKNIRRLILLSFTCIGLSLSFTNPSFAQEHEAANAASEELLNNSSVPALPASTTSETPSVPQAVSELKTEAAPENNESAVAPATPAVPAAEVAVPAATVSPAAAPAPTAEAAPSAPAKTPLIVTTEIKPESEVKPSDQVITTDVSSEPKEQKAADESKSEKKKKTAKKSKKKAETDFSEIAAASKADIPAAPPKSFSKRSDFGSIVVSDASYVSPNTKWVPASMGGSSADSRIQDISSPNYLLESDGGDDFLSSLRIPSKKTAKVAVARSESEESGVIEIERNTFKNAFDNAADKPVESKKEAAAEGAPGEATPEKTASAEKDGKFNALDGLDAQDNVDTSEVKEIELEALNYAEKAADSNKNFYLKDAGMKVEVKKQPKSDIATMKDAYDALKYGQIESAIQFYKKATAESPRDVKALFGLATAYHMAGQRSEAKATYKKVLAINPDYTQAVNNYIVIVGEESGPSAINELKNLMLKNPSYALIPAQVGSIYFRQKDYQKAAEFYAMAVNLDDSNNNYKYNLAVSFDRLGAFDRARGLYAVLLEKAVSGESVPFNMEEVQERFAELSNG